MNELQETGLHLLPQERWMAAKALRNREPPAGTERWRTWQNYGPRGIALMMAGGTDVLLGFAVGMLGVVLLGVSTGAGAAGHTGYVMVLVGMASILLGLIRFAQQARAGRRFRNGRAFIRPPK